MLKGEPTHAHFDAGTAIDNGKLWLFGGRPKKNGGAHRYVESYDFFSGQWNLEEALYPITYGIDYLAVTPIGGSKVLYYNMLPTLFNTESSESLASSTVV